MQSKAQAIHNHKQVNPSKHWHPSLVCLQSEVARQTSYQASGCPLSYGLDSRSRWSRHKVPIQSILLTHVLTAKYWQPPTISTLDGSEGPNPQFLIKEVWHMPTFSHSLLSTSKLHDDGNWYFSGQAEGDKNLYFLKKGTNRIWLTCKRGKSLNYPDWKIMYASRIKDAYVASYVAPGVHTPTQSGADTPESVEPVFTAENFAASANRATDKETPELWHQRLGHVRMTDLQNLVRTNSITGIKVPHTKLGKHTSIKCQTCVMAKFNRAKFKARERTEEVMHTLHSDITGPWSTPSLGGGLYVVSLIDEASGNGGVSVIKHKSAGADEIRRLILQWEAKTGKRCKVLFTDRGGEYVGNELKEWCLE
jgi:hypothetical protein